MPFLSPNQQCQSTEGKNMVTAEFFKTKFMSNVLEAISKLKLKNSKNHFSIPVLYLLTYRHMKLHSKQPVKQAAL